ncbi:MAG: BatD family protein [Pseudomonadota bacterium]
MRQLAGILFWLLLIPLSASAETLQAFVDRNQTRLDTPVQLIVSLPGRGGSVDTSTIRDFDVHSRGTSSRVEVINGRMRQEETHTFLLVPKRTGKLTVPAMTATLEGKTYSTEPIIVEVSERSEESAAEERDIEVIGRVTETSPYAGQQIVYTFLLRYGVEIANTQYTPPDFPGFSAKQIGEQQSRQQVVNGRRYQEVALSYVLIPTKSGEATIGPAVLRCDTMDSQSRRGSARDRMDPFSPDSFFGNRRLVPRVLKTDPIPLKVRSLPPETGSTPFSGLVGEFSMAASLETNEMKVGDSATLSISIQGTGNIMDAGFPTVLVPDAFKQYADSPQSDIQLGAAGYEGKKVFRLALVAVTPGDHQVVPAPVSYFDPEKGVYRFLSVAPVPIRVRASESPPEAPVVVSSPAESEALPGVQKKKVDFTGRDILPLKTGLDALESRGPLSGFLFSVALFLPALLFLIAQGVFNLKQKNRNPAAMMTQKSVFAMKQASRVADGAGEEFLSHLYRALVYAVCSKAKMRSESLTYEEAGQLLHAAGISEGGAGQVSDLLKKIDSARYSGKDLDLPARNALLTETTRVMKEVLR